MSTNGIHDQEVFTLLRQLADRGDDMTPVMTEISELLKAKIEENYEREGRPRWPALADATIAAREKKGHWPGKMLQVSGHLASSWTRRANRTQAIVGTNWPSARAHELGGQAGRGHKSTIPARPVRTLTARDIGEIKMMLMNYLFAKQ